MVKIEYCREIKSQSKLPKPSFYMILRKTLRRKIDKEKKNVIVYILVGSLGYSGSVGHTARVREREREREREKERI